MHKVVIVEDYKKNLDALFDRLRQERPELGEQSITLLTSNPEKYKSSSTLNVIETDYTGESLRSAFKTIGDDVCTVVCRQDKNIQYLIKITPFLSPDAYVSTAASLSAATSKRIMREKFNAYYPEISPRFMKVDGPTATISSELTYPLIVKPASLASSLLIQKCETPEELKNALKQTFAAIEKVHAIERRSETPEVIIEEYMQGDFYSIDSYALDGTFFHAPLVEYIPAQAIGIDDFFLYRRTTVISLNEEECIAARQVAEKAMVALGLKYTTAHIEMVLTKDGWKIIEVGPRVGRFRELMYRASYGIEHGYNDLLIHCGLPPILSERQRGLTAAYSIYPSHEGILEEISSSEEVKDHMATINYLHQDLAKIGQHVAHAKNGGHALYEIVFTNSDPAIFEEECRWFESHVKARVADR